MPATARRHLQDPASPGFTSGRREGPSGYDDFALLRAINTGWSYTVYHRDGIAELCTLKDGSTRGSERGQASKVTVLNPHCTVTFTTELVYVCYSSAPLSPVHPHVLCSMSIPTNVQQPKARTTTTTGRLIHIQDASSIELISEPIVIQHPRASPRTITHVQAPPQSICQAMMSRGVKVATPTAQHQTAAVASR